MIEWITEDDWYSCKDLQYFSLATILGEGSGHYAKIYKLGGHRISESGPFDTMLEAQIAAEDLLRLELEAELARLG